MGERFVKRQRLLEVDMFRIDCDGGCGRFIEQKPERSTNPEIVGWYRVRGPLDESFKITAEFPSLYLCPDCIRKVLPSAAPTTEPNRSEHRGGSVSFINDVRCDGCGFKQGREDLYGAPPDWWTAMPPLPSVPLGTNVQAGGRHLDEAKHYCPSCATKRFM